METFTYKVNDIDISKHVISANWHGDINQAARVFEFTIAFHPKDKYFPNIDIKIGNTIYVYYNDAEIFRGIIFFRERDTSNVTMQFTAYDYLIYLAKSKTTKKFKNITVESTITQVCNELGVLIGSITPIGVYVDFIADSQSGYEIIKQALEFAYATNKKQYHFYMSEGLLYVVEKGALIENYKATVDKNIEHTLYSESIEEMVNQVLITDNDGNSAGYVANYEDAKNYGMIQDVYKIDDKQDTQTQAKALLKGVSYVCSLSGLGDVRCITGYSIIIEDDQLQGKFNIKTDRHSISNNVHKMELELEYMGVAE